MKQIALLLLLSLCFISPAFAKRSPPVKVEPVLAADVEYHVPHDKMGCVEAWDVRTKLMIWRKQVYVVKYDVDLEKDVQDIFITSVEVQKGKLLIKNERQSEYELDLMTLQAKATKGSLLEQTQR
jgi:hypothetical protein